MSVRSFLALTGLGVYGVSLYGSYRWFRITAGGMHGTCGCPAGGGAQWDTLADSYDREVGLDETLMGLRLLRWWLVSHAQARWPPPPVQPVQTLLLQGDVLEVSAGTGRNLPFYARQQLTSLTLTDSSKAMLFHARAKAAAAPPGVPTAVHLSDAARLAARDGGAGRGAAGEAAAQSGAAAAQVAAPPREGEPAESPFTAGLRAFPPASFTTVVDTFGLCSHADPVATLRARPEMAAVCKPGGRLLLLEHGRASAGWLNQRLDDGAERHHAKFGCHWNRPILDIVAEAGLEVESVSRWHFGTTYLIVARPGRAALALPG